MSSQGQLERAVVFIAETRGPIAPTVDYFVIICELWAEFEFDPPGGGHDRSSPLRWEPPSPMEPNESVKRIRTSSFDRSDIEWGTETTTMTSPALLGL
ncbi:hypothetical protein MPTK1_5g14590 [Marchantia polymorpha subsp. ruderalis]|uniref:Uncharacterized protein n=2 Tax=Marchantia polymorpha TaxID=3197 RepID=A0AAF6BID7_MARPO|nr:hypothetical protein MARPO_0032s0151 [Marchantia polymorpha]BBN11771.1 hypothetical protein Mp_5g14590 [Marchantia polymorpha subsp. ruderalis]|eukprot:PTQ41989.1 hypothetical protein MARPO_0032s0151 [Marchantia polymorpha]